MNSKLLIKIDTDREKYTFSYAIADTANLGARVAYRQIGSGLNAGLSTEGTRTMTFTGTLFSLFAENGDGVFNIGNSFKLNTHIVYMFIKSYIPAIIIIAYVYLIMIIKMLCLHLREQI